MTIRQAIQQISGFGYILNSLNILSPAGRKELFSLPFLTNRNDIETAMDETETAFNIVNTTENERLLSVLFSRLTQLRDISGTVRLLSTKNTLTDIELFEIKHFALLAESVRELAGQLKISFAAIPVLEKIIDILDPEKKRIPHFYVYDRYSPALAALRTQLSRMSGQECDEQETEPVRLQAQLLEDKIRKDLVQQLFPHAPALSKALH
ncbi:MAG TPA: DNA mismatch repair protein MutS, partial [Porphyromonadaceae bacterium]|nr:DNA mismatch repair protein MutS [Porphyromonadaceae bacterium]